MAAVIFDLYKYWLPSLFQEWVMLFTMCLVGLEELFMMLRLESEDYSLHHQSQKMT